MHALLQGGHEGEAAVTQEPKLSPRRGAAQLVTARPFRCSQSPLDSTQPAAAPPTDHRRRKLHPLPSGGFNGSAQQEASQRKLGNGVRGPFRSLAENSTDLAGKRSAPGGNALWAMESSKDVSLCACAAGGDSVQPRRGSVAKHRGCCSLLAVRRLGAFPSHRLPDC